jgi:hypothetical protein
VPAVDSNLFLTNKQRTNLNIFWAGFAIYIVGYMFTVFPKPEYIVSQGAQTVGIILVIIASASLIKSRIDDKYLKNVFLLFCIWSAGVIGRGIKLDYNSLKQLFFDPGTGLMSYLVPLVVLFPRSVGTYKSVFNISIIFGLLYAVLAYIFFKEMRSYDFYDIVSTTLIENFAALSAPLLFLLITYKYHKVPSIILAAVVNILCIYFAIVRARRGLLFINLFTIAAGIVLLVSSTKQKGLAIFLTICLVASVFVFYSAMSSSGGMFSVLQARKDEDTRSNVEQSMRADMSNRDMLWGRGINGEYYCPGVMNAATGEYTRNIIETGYLQIILKGGYIHLLLFALILIPAVFRGLFKSENLLVKGAALWILLWMVYLYPTVGTGFSLYYIIVWLGVGLCYSEKIRNMRDDDIKAMLLK